MTEWVLRRWWTRRSLRARLTAAATVATALALSAAGYAFTVIVHASLLDNADNTALLRARAVGAAVKAGGANAVADVERHSDAVVQVVAPNGSVIVSSANARDVPRLFMFVPNGSETVRTSSKRIPVADSADSYRVAVVRAPGGVLVYAAVAGDDVQDTTRIVQAAVAAGVPVLTALLALLTWFLVGRALRPVEVLREQAARITATGDRQRLTPSAAHDELHRLAQTLNQMLDRLDSSARRQREFVADAAHELRSPLTALRTQLEVAAAHPDPSGAVAVPVLLEEVDRIAALVDNLLHLARLDDQQQARPRRIVDLDDVVFTEVARIRGLARVDVDLRDVSAAQVDGDVVSLSRLVRNLLDNAVRHATTHVDVSLQSVDGHLVMTVTDDGPGVPVADRERIFERFARLEEARSRNEGGFGLGLAIVRDVAVAHGGRAFVADHQPGARFVVELPVADRSAPGAQPVVSARSSPAGR